MYDRMSLFFKNYRLKYPATSLPKNYVLTEDYFPNIFFLSLVSPCLGGRKFPDVFGSLDGLKFGA